MVRATIDLLVARVPGRAADRWHARTGLGLMLLLSATQVGALALALGGSAQLGQILWMLVALLAASGSVVVTALTGRWKIAFASSFAVFFSYVVAMQVFDPWHPMALVGALFLFQLLSVFVLGHRHAWPSALAVLGAGFGAQWVRPELSWTQVDVLANVTVVAVVTAGLWWLERARNQAAHEAELRASAHEDAAIARGHAEARQRFLATMSHEIRTPMNGVLNTLRLIDDVRLDEDVSELVRTALSSSEALLVVLNDVLDFSRIESGELLIERAPFEPERLANDVLNLFRQPAQERGVRVDLWVETKLPARVVGDSTRVRQVLTNLVSNAIKFTHEGGVRLRVRREGDELVFQVEDTGIGIAESALPRLFDPFIQADASTTRRFGGTGLGLAICHRLCEAMEGSLHVHSRLHEGSTFTVRLPLPEPSGVVDPSSAASLLEGSILPDLRVLVAEDNPVNQMVIDRLCRRLGATPVVVGDGLAAIEAAAGATWDLVLMDLHMPRCDGLEATRAIRAAEAPGGRLFIVALTASVLVEDQLRAEEAGMDLHMAKPVDPVRLGEVLAQASQRRGRRRAS